MLREAEQYTRQFESDNDQIKSSLARALSGMLRAWINLYGDLPSPQSEDELEKAREAVLSRGPVIQEVEPLPSTLKPGRRPNNFLLRVSRSGHIVTVDTNGNNPSTIVDSGTVRFCALKTQGYNIHFYEDLPNASGESNPNMAIAVAGDSATKEKLDAIWRYEREHPVLGGLHTMVGRLTYETIESQYQSGLGQIIDGHLELKP